LILQEIGSHLRSAEVCVSTEHNGYPARPPYSPPVGYPEYPFARATLGDHVNPAYEGVRDALRGLGLDGKHAGEEGWNPLGTIVQPGYTVVLKPNFVRDFRETRAGHADCLITHGSIIRAALDYVYIALQGQGRIVIADAPQNDADFDAIRRIAGLDEIQDFYRRHAHFDVEVYDLRPERARKIRGVIVDHERLSGDPAGYVKVDLGRYSEFYEISQWCHRLYGAEYNTAELRSHHHDDIHEYLISKTVMDADCVISLPKLKTHKKTGITVCLKNLVGINGNKNWLPHHREGTPSQGGDQFADDGLRHRIERQIMIGFRHLFPLLGPIRSVVAKPCKAIGKGVFGDTNTNTIRSGNWYGNDTTWRMALDLNRILMYADRNGLLQEHPTRRIFCIVDGIVGGEGNGPLDPTPKPAGVVLAGANPVAVDLASARLIGFDYRCLPLLARALAVHPLPLATFAYDDVACVHPGATVPERSKQMAALNWHFQPHFGWQGHVERSG
jgi:uncharacterized protein (DUF362 family)